MNNTQIEKPKPEPISIRKNTIWNVGGCGFYQACQWLTTILAVILSPDFQNSGVLAFAMAIGNIFAPIATYNLRTFQVSDVNDEYSANNYIAFRIVTTVGAAFFCIIYTLVVAPSVFIIIATCLFLLFKTDEAFSNVLYGIYQKNGRMDYIGVSQLIRGVFSLLGFFIFLYAFSSLPLAIIAMTVGCFLTTLFYDLPHAKRFGSIRPLITKRITSNILITCLPIVLASVFCSAIVSVARQYFGIVGGEELLGIYAAVATPAVIVQAAAAYLYSPIITPIAKYWTKRDPEKIKTTMLRFLLILSCVALLVLVVFYAWGHQFLILVFGESIAPYTYLLTPALISACLIAYEWFFMDILITFRNFKGVLISTIAGFITCLVTMVFFIQTWGMNGINFTIILAFIVSLLISIFYVARNINHLKAK